MHSEEIGTETHGRSIFGGRVSSCALGLLTAITFQSAASSSQEFDNNQNAWVKVFEAVEYNAPGGRETNRLYYGQKLTVEKRVGRWTETTGAPGAVRWMKTSDLSSVQPPPKRNYAGAARFEDPRLDRGAISAPGENGLSAADVALLWRGARMVLDKHPDCHIGYADKDIHRQKWYFVTCTQGDATNVFFTAKQLDSK